MERSELVERLRAIEENFGAAHGLGQLRELQMDIARQTPSRFDVDVAKLPPDELALLKKEVDHYLGHAGVEEFAKALAVTIVGVGGVPGPGMIRECVRLGRDFYDELETPTPRPPEDEEGKSEEEY